jgi:adenylate cyclase
MIIRAPGNVHPVFDTILEKALRLCDASYCILWSFDGSCFRPSASRLPDRIRELLVGFAVPTRVSETHVRLLRGEPLVHTADISAELDGSGDDPLRYALTAEARARTLLMVPLNKGDELVGALSLYRTSVRLFANRQINLVQHLAAQTVIAIENARLVGELRERTEEIAELNRGLEARIAEQVEELSRVGRLKRFLAPQLAELIVSQGQ